MCGNGIRCLEKFIADVTDSHDTQTYTPLLSPRALSLAPYSYGALVTSRPLSYVSPLTPSHSPLPIPMPPAY
ncbi:unnamed protein product [Closterium sp. Naga37s-1]|nr:unnamed protein product [Closterium sp. Naga37s-1]